MHPSLGLARPYPGTVVQVQVTDADDADATIKILSVCTAVPGYSRRNNQNYASVTWTCTTVPGYGRASPSDRCRWCRRNNQNSKCLHSRTRVQQTQQSKLCIRHLDLHDRTRVRSCKPKWQMPTVHGYSRQWFKMTWAWNQAYIRYVHPSPPRNNVNTYTN